MFKLESWLDAANTLVSADEPILARQLLDCLPAEIRDNPPKEITELKNLIFKLMMTPYDYMALNEEIKIKEKLELHNYDEICVQALNSIHRFQVVREYIRQSDELCHIVDLGPGDFILPLALHKLGLKFTYEPIGLHQDHLTPLKTWLGDKLTNERSKNVIFVGFEIIEHLRVEDELKQAFIKHAQEANKVFISTPRYCYDGYFPGWKQRGYLHHLRTYTPSEFVQTVMQLFPEFSFVLYNSQIMVLEGTLKDEQQK